MESSEEEEEVDEETEEPEDLPLAQRVMAASTRVVIAPRGPPRNELSEEDDEDEEEEEEEDLETGVSGRSSGICAGGGSPR
jgi:hypothetical protein